MAQDADEPGSDDIGSGPLTWWQRALAGLVGVAMTGAGGYSVFKTSNQAGSATLLIFGCIFMISSLNGAQIQGLKLKDSDVSWYKAKVRREYAKAAEQQPPEEGRKILDVLESADPQAARDPVVQQASGFVYEREVLEALHRISAPARVEAEAYGGPDRGADAVLETAVGRIAIIIKYGSHGIIASQVVRTLVTRAASFQYAGILLITNSIMSRVFREQPIESVETEYSVKISIARWSDAHHDDSLREALSDLTSRIRDEQSS